MNLRILAPAACALLLLGGEALAGKPLENIPLQWKPTSTLGEMGPLDVSGALLSRTIHIEPFRDVRQNTALIAENHEKESHVMPVTTTDDVGVFVSQHLADTMKKAGLNIVDGPADVTLSGDIRDFFVLETGTYHGSVSLLVHAKDAHGKEIWSGVVAGGAERFGRSYKAENYYEVISDMLIRAAYNLMAGSEFHQALAAN